MIRRFGILIASLMVMSWSPSVSAQGVIKLVGCASQKGTLLRSGKEWRKLLTKSPTRENWRDAIGNWGDESPLTEAQCLMIRRLQGVANAYRMDSARVPIKALRNEYVSRGPDWFDHANSAFRRGLVGEAQDVIDAQRKANAPLVFERVVGDLYSEVRIRRMGDKVKPIPPTDPVSAAWTKGRLQGEARAWLSEGGFAQSAVYFERAGRFGFDPPIELERGYALYRAGDSKGAKAAFEQVEAKGSGTIAEVAAFWLTFLKSGAR